MVIVERFIFWCQKVIGQNLSWTMFNFEQPDKLGLNFDLGSSRLYVQQHRPIIVIGALLRNKLEWIALLNQRYAVSIGMIKELKI